MAGLFEGASAGTLRSLAAAFRDGRLAADASPFSVNLASSCPPEVRDRILSLCSEGLSPAHMAVLLELAAELAETRATRSVVDLVWTGPETGAAHSRDTAVVLDEMFSHAEHDVLVSTFVVQQVATVFAPLARRMEERPVLSARIFLHVNRGPGDTTDEAVLLRQFADRLASQWTAARRPEVYYDPRGLQADASARATWHAKCVIVDGRQSFVTSANFTEWAQQRNVEAGVLVKSRTFASQLRHQFDALVEAKLVRRLPAW